ncbi:MAG: hypothetical protein K0Q72_1137 [Armatimonadetes bacterium]|jgi:hypothetical protein|nr:hypothetical protein [Armatimonadota bacterium]
MATTRIRSHRVLGTAAWLALTVLVPVAAGEEKAAPQSQQPDPAVEPVRKIFRTQDSYAVAEFLEAEGEPKAVAQRYYRVMNDLYWKKHDLPALVVVGRSGVLYCLSRAKGADEKTATDLRGIGKAMAYDLASFTWPGWADEGISPTPADEATGFDAARTNLRLAVELKRGAEPMHNAHWVLGAHLLGAGKFPEAIRSFQQSAEFARQAKNRGAELMAQGYASLARVLSAPEPAAAEKELRVNFEAIVKEKDGEFYRDQIVAARKVFEARFKRMPGPK